MSAEKIKSNSHLKTFNMRFQVAHKDDPTIPYNVAIYIYVDTVFSKIVYSARSCNPCAEDGEGKADFNDKHLLNGELNCCTGRTGEPFSGLKMYIS